MVPPTNSPNEAKKPPPIQPVNTSKRVDCLIFQDNDYLIATPLQVTDTEEMILLMKCGDRTVDFLCLDTEESKQVNEKVLTGKTYPILPYASQVKVILDVGANLGAASVFFSVLYPEAAIYSVEPQKNAFDFLTRNTALNPNNKIFKIGLFDKNTELPLHHSWADSSTASIGLSWLNTNDYENIALRDAAEWIREQNLDQIDILKIDTEGCEVPILSSLKEYIPKIQIIYIEYHNDADRRAISNLIGDSHVLVHCKTEFPHRGELAYVRADLGDESSELHKHRIKMPSP